MAAGTQRANVYPLSQFDGKMKLKDWSFNFGIGPNDATQWVLNVQPVIPISLNNILTEITPHEKHL